MGKTDISRGDAIRLASEEVQARGVASLAGRDAVAIEEADHWHVYFPLSSPEALGGEPHVLVDKFSGAIIRVYYTQ